MAQAYLGGTELNKLYLGNTQINDVEVGKYPISGLVAAYVPGETNGRSGSIIFDLSGNGNNLTVSGTSSYSNGVYSITGSTSNIESNQAYTALTGSDPTWTLMLFLRTPGTPFAIQNLWYLGNPTSTVDQMVYDDNASIQSFAANKIMFSNGDANTNYPLYNGNSNLAADYTNYNRVDFTMMSLSRNISSSFSGSNINGKIYVKNFRQDGLDTTNTIVTSKTYVGLNPDFPQLGVPVSTRAITTNWSSVNPKLFIGPNPSDPTYGNRPIDFAGAFIYNRVLTNFEIESVYSYVNSITPLT
jgi:hypothetical protein